MSEHTLNPSYSFRVGEAGPREEKAFVEKPLSDSVDELAAAARRVGKPLVGAVTALFALSVLSFCANVVLLTTTARAGSCLASANGVAAAAGLELVNGGAYFRTTSSCMSDQQLQAVPFFVVNSKATNGLVFSLKPASTLRVPVNSSQCKSGVLVRSFDPSYDAYLVDDNAVLFTKAQSQQLVALAFQQAAQPNGM